MSTVVAQILDVLRDRGGLRGADIANIVDVSPPTVSRWTKGKASPPIHTQTVIADLRYVVDRLSDFYTPDETRLWLHASHPLLNQERAIDLISSGRTEEVLAVIERLEAGAYLQSMSSGRRAREIELLDALDALEPVSVNATVWRAVRDGHDPLLGHRSAGRWDPGQFDVLYTSFDPDGAVSEIHFHLSRQPVFPSKIEFFLHEISVRTSNTLKFADLRELQPLGVDEKEYTVFCMLVRSQLEMRRTSWDLTA